MLAALQNSLPHVLLEDQILYFIEDFAFIVLLFCFVCSELEVTLAQWKNIEHYFVLCDLLIEYIQSWQLCL
jgi:hypothetical protein